MASSGVLFRTHHYSNFVWKRCSNQLSFGPKTKMINSHTSFSRFQTKCVPYSTLLRHPFVGLFPNRLYSDGDVSTDNVSKLEVANLVQSRRVVLFMKGNPDEPRCGFSHAVCRILEIHGIFDKANNSNCTSGTKHLFTSYDVLESDELRQAVKLYSDWPTFPQLYFDGHFVGGCDIVLDMHRSGKLVEELERLGIGSVLDREKPIKNHDDDDDNNKTV